MSLIQEPVNFLCGKNSKYLVFHMQNTHFLFTLSLHPGLALFSANMDSVLSRDCFVGFYIIKGKQDVMKWIYYLEFYIC